MAWFPGAIRKVVARHKTLMARHRGVCFHVAVSEGASLFGYFNQPGNPTSHFYVRRDGAVEQYVDTEFRAPAQLEGNPTMIGVETQGGVHDVDTEPWTAEQVDSLARIAAWCNTTHGIPLVGMPDSRPESVGVGSHRLGIDPWRVTGGEQWSESYAKVCPGDGKLAQIPGIIKLARGDDMPLSEADADLVAKRLLAYKASDGHTMNDLFVTTYNRAGVSNQQGTAVQSMLKAMNPQLDEIETVLNDEDLQTDRIEAALQALDADALADRIIAKLPVGSDTIDLAALKAAAKDGVKEALREGTGA